jgi:hypothetical protein
MAHKKLELSKTELIEREILNECRYRAKTLARTGGGMHYHGALGELIIELAESKYGFKCEMKPMQLVRKIQESRLKDTISLIREHPAANVA